MSRVSDPDRLDELMLRTGADIRSPLLLTLVDLYLQKPAHTKEEARHFSELTLRLLEQADPETCTAVARRLASYPSAPAAIMQRLAADVSQPLKESASPGSTTGFAPSPDLPSQHRSSPHELTELFFAAGAAERGLILINLAYAAEAESVVDLDTSGDAAHQLEIAALRRNTDAFARLLERRLGIGPSLARRIVGDPLGEPIVVTAKRLGMAPDALQRILLFINPAVARSVSRVYELAALFDAIDVRSAHVLVGIWRAADPRAGRAASIAAADRGARRGAERTAALPQRGPAGAQSDSIPCAAWPRTGTQGAAK